MSFLTPANTTATAGTSSAADLEFFVQYRSTLSQSAGTSSSLQLTAPPSGHSHLGIYNHGATCYLNSILQTLYYDDWFRNTILSLTSEELPPILKELQRFLSFLTLSENGAVSAVDLIASFGWSKAQVAHFLLLFYYYVIMTLCYNISFS